MQFLIRNVDGKRWLYDNTNNHIDIFGDTTLLNTAKAIYRRKTDSCELTACKEAQPKSRTVGKLRILVGTNCNYKCSFCVQVDDKFNSKVVNEEGIDEFLSRMDANDIKLKPDGKIEFWGGEPLVYWKSLRHLIPKLRKRYPAATMSMISNGTLIKPHMVDLLIENRVDLTFSHDAQAYFLRGPDPLDDPKMQALWKDIFHRYREAKLSFGLNCVISQYNSDLYAVQRFFREKIHPEISFGFEGLVIAHSPSAIKLCHFPKAAREQLRASIRKAVFDDKGSQLSSIFTEKVYKMLKDFTEERNAYRSNARCDIMRDSSLVVDLHGNVLRCHNVSNRDWILGDIEHLDDIKLDRYTSWDKRKNCPECHLASLCKGNCPITNESEHLAGCYTQKIYYGILFEIMAVFLTGSEIESITKAEQVMYNN